MDAIKTLNLTKKYKDKTVVNKLNLTVKEGELYSLLGVNGAGKSTTIKMLSCLIPPTDGDATLLGNSIKTHPHEVKKIISVSPQETAVAEKLSVRENLEFMARLYGSTKSEAKSKADHFIEKFEMSDFASSRAKALSGGQQRRLSIAMALITQPKILFLDEPTLGLDVVARHELWNMISTLKGKITIILTTHYLEEAKELSDRIGIMAKGELKAEGNADELQALAGDDNFESAFIKLAQGGINL